MTKKKHNQYSTSWRHSESQSPGTAYTAQLRLQTINICGFNGIRFQFGNDQDHHFFARTVSISVGDTNFNPIVTDSENRSDFLFVFVVYRNPIEFHYLQHLVLIHCNAICNDGDETFKYAVTNYGKILGILVQNPSEDRKFNEKTND